MEKIILENISKIESISKSKEVEQLLDGIWNAVANIDIMLEYNIDKNFEKLDDKNFGEIRFLEEDELNYIIQIDKGHPIN